MRELEHESFHLIWIMENPARNKKECSKILDTSGKDDE